MAYAVFASRSTRCNPEEGARKMETQQASHDSLQHADTGDPHEESSTPIHNNIATDSPSLTPLHLPRSEEEGSSVVDSSSSPTGGAAVGTPSTVSTAPSTGDDDSTEGISKAGLEKMPFLWENATSSDAVPLPRPRDPGIPPMIPRVLDPVNHESTLPEVKLSPTLSATTDQRQQPNHRRSRSWGEGTSRHLVGPAYQRSTSAITEQRPSSVDPPPGGGSGMLHFTLPGVHGAQHGAFQTNYYQSSPTTSPPYSLPHTPPRTHMEQHSWAAAAASGATQQPRVASFRTDPSILEGGRYAYAPVPSPEAWPRDGPRQQQQQYIGQHVSGYHTPPYPTHRIGQGGGAYGHHSPPAAASSPRGPRTPRQQTGPHQRLPGTPAVTTPPRSSSEILKTLLRKKACLYEPDTSRAVALVTWMVGRELALEHGYFSRQQLQSGVHACVAKKIESGKITRTKVNRCMQIILNSCFHYIIPRPDGTEESGAAFREAFARTAKDDSYLVLTLEPPWDDLLVDRESILKASSGDGDDKVSATPDNSPTLESVKKNEPSAPKRTVLLCFNENVRSVEDVFRCHTEFIRDTANASKLQLPSQEWRSFFGKDGRSGALGVPTALTQPFDSLGQFGPTELAQFRTTWCAKRYDHDHDLCGFAHVEVNGGWLRRNPVLHVYKDDMCPSISTILDDRWGPNCFVINSCPKGEDCPYAHSKEEIDYHPNRYKSHTCSALFNSRGNPVLGRCPLGDVCPNLHPSDASLATRLPESSASRKPPQRTRQARDFSGQARTPAAAGGAGGVVPEGAPMLYINPAPVSQFETRLGMPGLQSLFRRHCHVINAHLRGGPDRCKCNYSNFGDDWGISFKAL